MKNQPCLSHAKRGLVRIASSAPLVLPLTEPAPNSLPEVRMAKTAKDEVFVEWAITNRGRCPGGSCNHGVQRYLAAHHSPKLRFGSGTWTPFQKVSDGKWRQTAGQDGRGCRKDRAIAGEEVSAPAVD
jgi:hypothetical protein